MEEVVLVDEQNNPIGTALKAAVHTKNTPLHRGFSVFLFGFFRQQILLTQRAPTKKTFPGLWSNTVCGHPGPNESVVEAARRRLKDELGMVVDDIKEVAPYRYKFADKNGIVENEICPILVAKSYAYPRPNPQEISSWKWMPWSAFLTEVMSWSATYTPWCGEEALILEQSGVLKPAKVT